MLDQHSSINLRESSDCLVYSKTYICRLKENLIKFLKFCQFEPEISKFILIKIVHLYAQFPSLVNFDRVVLTIGAVVINVPISFLKAL